MNTQFFWTKFKMILLLTAAIMMTGCASPYLDGNLREIPASNYKKPAIASPVQLLFEFQTKGLVNSRATTALKDQVASQVKTSGLFSEVSDGPVPTGATLSIVINNVALTDASVTKGVVTGLTFGLVGTQVSDGYVCTATYRAQTNAEPIVKKFLHAIHTNIGAGSAPPNAIKMANLNDAGLQMGKDVVSNMLNDISRDVNFK